MGETRIAIVDESPAFVAAAVDYLARVSGFVICGTAHSASQAVDLVRRAAPDVLLLDLGLSPARGLQRVRDVKEVSGAPAIIAMTLFHSPEAAAAARAAGADALVGKEAFVSGLTQVLAALFPAKAA